MARLPRIIAPDWPHHVTQRGNRRQAIFLQADDYALYQDLLTEQCALHDVAVWSYCFMPNHVHLILVPRTEDGLWRAVGETHRRYTSYINARLRLSGHLFQGRYGSVVMNETHLMAAFRYVALNPVKAGVVEQPQHWQWSSTPAHMAGVNDALVDVQPLLERVHDVAGFLNQSPEPRLEQALQKGQSVGRPLLDDSELETLETTLQRRLRPRKAGRPKRSEREQITK